MGGARWVAQAYALQPRCPRDHADGVFADDVPPSGATGAADEPAGALPAIRSRTERRALSGDKARAEGGAVPRGPLLSGG